jgi:hypothetical protein
VASNASLIVCFSSSICNDLPSQAGPPSLSKLL